MSCFVLPKPAARFAVAGGLLIVFKVPMLVKYKDNPELRVLSLLRTASLKHCASPHSVLTIVAILFSHTSADDSSSFHLLVKTGSIVLLSRCNMSHFHRQ